MSIDYLLLSLKVLDFLFCFSNLFQIFLFFLAGVGSSVCAFLLIIYNFFIETIYSFKKVKAILFKFMEISNLYIGGLLWF
jgi:hypothetical protein